jgi:hypothetical protein
MKNRSEGDYELSFEIFPTCARDGRNRPSLPEHRWSSMAAATQHKAKKEQNL